MIAVLPDKFGVSKFEAQSNLVRTTEGWLKPPNKISLNPEYRNGLRMAIEPQLERPAGTRPVAPSFIFTAFYPAASESNRL